MPNCLCFAKGDDSSGEFCKNLRSADGETRFCIPDDVLSLLINIKNAMDKNIFFENIAKEMGNSKYIFGDYKYVWLENDKNIRKIYFSSQGSGSLIDSGGIGLADGSFKFLIDENGRDWFLFGARVQRLSEKFSSHLVEEIFGPPPKN